MYMYDMITSVGRCTIVPPFVGEPNSQAGISNTEHNIIFFGFPV